MDDDERKGAHGRRLLAELLDLAPRAHRRRRRNELNRPHFVEARVAVVAGEYVHGVVVDDGAVGGARRRRIARIPRHPVAGGEAVLVQVVLVAQVRVRVQVARVASENKHAVVVDNGRVVRSRRQMISVECP